MELFLMKFFSFLFCSFFGIGYACVCVYKCPQLGLEPVTYMDPFKPFTNWVTCQELVPKADERISVFDGREMLGFEAVETTNFWVDVHTPPNHGIRENVFYYQYNGIYDRTWTGSGLQWGCYEKQLLSLWLDNFKRDGLRFHVTVRRPWNLVLSKCCYP